MIPTFVITLREGVEASLIVGIIAAFLVKEGRQDAMRQMWIGVAIAIVLCTAVGVGLDLVGEQLPQKRAGGPGDDHRPDRRRRRHLHDHLDAPPRAQHQGHARGRGGLGAGHRLDHGPGRDGLPRGPARGLRDLGLPARRLPGLDRHHRRRRRRGARAGRGDRDRARALPRRRPHQPHPLLPLHRPDPRLRRRRPARLRRPHRPRGGLDQQPPGPGARPHLAGPAGHGQRRAADRDAGPAADPDPDRGRRLPALRGADGALRPLARPPAPPPREPRRGRAPGRAAQTAA